MKYVDGKAKVVNGLGEFYFTIDADPETGVIYMFAGPTEEGRLSQGVSSRSGRTGAPFVHDVQGADMRGELFGSQFESLRREFGNIRRRFAGERATHASVAAGTTSSVERRRFLLAKATQRWNELLAGASPPPAMPASARPTARCSCPCTKRTGCGWANWPGAVRSRR